MSEKSAVDWDAHTWKQFQQLLEKIPVFLRATAKAKVLGKAEALVRAQGRAEVMEKDLVDAFFEETPFGFHGPLKSDMEAIGIDYVGYGHPR